ncbi:hypothetical protein POM88_020087 [Heracleum sosnowskyi]|uniref:Uncharacterized protein n=1 Tax=Heracleum sosnowskyi TaxID=360622 RepID=A0AAD8MRH6_9APIA|nr:hypothetical protein POM88_020087 [Heracleum sosnowskyi]
MKPCLPNAYACLGNKTKLACYSLVEREHMSITLLLPVDTSKTEACYNLICQKVCATSKTISLRGQCRVSVIPRSSRRLYTLFEDDDRGVRKQKLLLVGSIYDCSPRELINALLGHWSTQLLILHAASLLV